jgi:hypothetical protein
MRVPTAKAMPSSSIESLEAAGDFTTFFCSALFQPHESSEKLETSIVATEMFFVGVAHP